MNLVGAPEGKKSVGKLNLEKMKRDRQETG
jgi:hypothetical protein